VLDEDEAVPVLGALMDSSTRRWMGTESRSTVMRNGSSRGCDVLA
jgi:hypothetical protein